MEAEKSMETFAHNARGLGNCHVQNVMVMGIIYVQIVMAEVTLVTVIIVTFQSAKAVYSNPIEGLKKE